MLHKKIVMTRKLRQRTRISPQKSTCCRGSFPWRSSWSPPYQQPSPETHKSKQQIRDQYNEQKHYKESEPWEAHREQIEKTLTWRRKTLQEDASERRNCSWSSSSPLRPYQPCVSSSSFKNTRQTNPKASKHRSRYRDSQINIKQIKIRSIGDDLYSEPSFLRAIETVFGPFMAILQRATN